LKVILIFKLTKLLNRASIIKLIIILCNIRLASVQMEKVASGSLLFLLIVKCMTVEIESSGDCKPFGLRLGLGNKYQVPTSA
jgi:hypothetical protein